MLHELTKETLLVYLRISWAKEFNPGVSGWAQLRTLSGWSRRDAAEVTEMRNVRDSASWICTWRRPHEKPEKEYAQPLRATASPERWLTQTWGAQSCNHQELRWTNKLNALGKEFFSPTTKECSPADTLILASWNPKWSSHLSLPRLPIYRSLRFQKLSYFKSLHLW